MAQDRTASEDVLDVRQAAALVDRHPETIRRRIWAGKLAASRRGNRLLVRREDLESEFGTAKKSLTLAEWAKKLEAYRERERQEGRASRGGANLVLEEREARWRADDPRARR